MNEKRKKDLKKYSYVLIPLALVLLIVVVFNGSNGKSEEKPKTEEQMKQEIINTVQRLKANETNIIESRQLRYDVVAYMSPAYIKYVTDIELNPVIKGYDDLHEMLSYTPRMYNETVTVLNLKNKPPIAEEQSCWRNENVKVVNYHTNEDVTYKYPKLKEDAWNREFLEKRKAKVGESEWKIITREEMLKFNHNIDKEKQVIECKG